MDFSPKCYLFCECNSVRIGQNIQNGVSLERSIFADVVAYQFVNFNWKLNGSTKENMHRSIWNENDERSNAYQTSFSSRAENETWAQSKKKGVKYRVRSLSFRLVQSKNYDFILKRLKTPKYKRYRNIMLCYVIKNRLKRKVFKRKAFYNVRQLFCIYW